MKKGGNSRVFILLAVIIFVLDQLTKLLISSLMSLGQSISLIPSILHITYIHNFGAGFSILQNQRCFFIVFSLIVIGVIFYNYKKIISNKKLSITVALILAGAVGNLIDRLFHGYVIDFIDFRIWPVFNIADTSLTIGTILLVWYFWKEK